MRLLLLVLLLVCRLDGFGIGVINCDLSDASMIKCASKLFDRNKDDVITMDELVRSFQDKITYTSNFNATIIMNGGDVNGDGVLTIDDWNHPNRTYLKEDISKGMACFWCRRNGVNMDLEDEKRRAENVDFRRIQELIQQSKKT